jgi:hypothetical protein
LLTSIPPPSSPPERLAAVERVLRGLARRRRACVEQVVSEARTLDDYAQLAGAETEDLADTVRKGFDAVATAIAGQRSLDDEDVAFLWPHIRRRTAAGVSEGEMMAVVRIFQRVLWDAIVELAGDDEHGRSTALLLARPLIDYIDVLSETVDSAYREAGAALASGAANARLELIELLLSGAPPAPGATLNAARTAGLDDDPTLVVIVGRQTAPDDDPATLRIAAGALARLPGSAIEALAAVRDDELVVVGPLRGPAAELLADGIASAHARLRERGISLAVGASTVHQGLAAVPAAYAEACLALEQVRDESGVLALSGLDVLDYLILRAGDGTAWRLIPAVVREFVEDDSRSGSILSTTLLAYAGSDLSVKLAAQQLFVHPNTAHYRLAKIEARTGCDVRKLRDVQLLTTAIHLHHGRGDD